MTSSLPRVSVLVAVVVAAGCVSPTALQTARVLPVGDVRMGAAIEAFRGPDPFRSDPAPFAWRPQVEVFARKGISERVDCGGKLWFPFLRGDCKFEAVRSNWLDAAVAAGGAVHFNPGGYLFDAYLPTLFVDLNLVKQPFEPGAITLVASGGPIGRCYLAEGRDPAGCWLQLGGSLGVVAQATDAVALMVEAAHYRTLIRPGEAMGTGILSGFQLAAGVQVRILSAATSP